MKRKIFAYIAAFLMMWGVIWVYNTVTDGFSVREILSSLEEAPFVEDVSLTKEKKEEIEAIFDQPYRYIGKGCQFYAFESADHNYVLKFFKQKHLRPFTWLKQIPLPQTLRQIADAKITRRHERVHNLISSCHLAYEELSEETGVLYFHFEKRPLFEKKVVLIDNLGFKHAISIDEVEFVLQKKAITVREMFERLLQEGKEAAIHEKISQLMHLVEGRCAKGIRDRDRSFVQNVAFSSEEERAVFIDIGQFYRDETVRQEGEKQRDLKRRYGSLKAWSSEKFPPLLPYLDRY